MAPAHFPARALILGRDKSCPVSPHRSSGTGTLARPALTSCPALCAELTELSGVKAPGTGLQASRGHGAMHLHACLWGLVQLAVPHWNGCGSDAWRGPRRWRRPCCSPRAHTRMASPQCGIAGVSSGSPGESRPLSSPQTGKRRVWSARAPRTQCRSLALGQKCSSPTLSAPLLHSAVQPGV